MEAPDAPAPPTQAPKAPRQIAVDVPCSACGYNLRSLDRSALCPECGQPVAVSLQRLIALRRYGDPAALRRAIYAALGALGVLVVMVVAFTIILNMYFELFRPSPPWVDPTLIAILVLGTVGGAVLHLLAARYASRRRFATSARRVSRGGRALQRVTAITLACTVAIWLMAALDGWLDWIDLEDIWPAIVVSVILSTAAFFPPLLLLRLRSEARIWPFWPALPKLLLIAATGLLLAGGVWTIVVIDQMALLALDRNLPQPIMEAVAVRLGLSYIPLLIAYPVLLIICLGGLRKVSRLPEGRN